MNASNHIPEEIKELVLARLETFPAHIKISVGSYGSFDKEELIEHVKKEDNIGRKMIEIELEFLQSLKEDILL